MTPLGFVALPFLIALALTLGFGGRVITALAARNARQPISENAPASHAVKQGTPTMGGLLILGAVAVTTAAVAAWFGRYIDSERLARLLAVLATFLFAGLVGLMDDLGKVRRKQNKAGLSERAKLSLQVIVAVGFVVFLASTQRPDVTTVLRFGTHSLDLHAVYYVLGVLYICLFGNAVNFTDGLDGLASGVTLAVTLALGATLGAAAREVGVFYGALAGACAGFLCFNAYPARVFMGDTGSLALGMGLAAAALATKQEILLLVVGVVYLAEIASMIIQRYVFKYRRIKHGIEYAKSHRVFRRAPLHHHFEELGWGQAQVAAWFWVAGLAAAALGLLAAPTLGGTTR